MKEMLGYQVDDIVIAFTIKVLITPLVVQISKLEDTVPKLSHMRDARLSAVSMNTVN